MMGLFSCFLKDYLEVSQRGERVIRVLVTVTDLFPEWHRKRDVWTSSSEYV